MHFATWKDGFALPAVLLALVVIGALVTGGMYTAMAADRGSANMHHGNHAFLAAERGLQDLLGTKTRLYFQDTVGVDGLVGSADTLGPVAINVGGVDAEYTLHVQRLAVRLFKVDSEGVVTGAGRYAGSKRTLSEVMRIGYTYVPKDRAITTQDALTMRGQSGVSGQDQVPAGWEDCTDEGLQKSVVAKDVEEISVLGGGATGGLTGDTLEESTLDSLDFIEYGDMYLDELKAMADKVYPDGSTLSGIGPSSSGGFCNTDVLDNWGDPADPNGPCHYYWPIIHATGDLHVSGSGKGQGILVVDGDLSISGNFEFSGLVFVYGSLKASGTGNKFAGSVNILGAGDSFLGANASGNTQIVLSSCAIERAHVYNDRYARPMLLAERSFTDMSGLGID